jgi:hypothetical protein
MSIRLPDDRELKIDVQLQAIYMPTVGEANGYYSVFNFTQDPQNQRPLNYNNKNNDPNIPYGNPAAPLSNFKLGSNLKILSF